MSRIAIKHYDETQVADEIVRVLPAEITRTTSDSGSIRFAVRGDGMKLRTIVFRRESLRRLIEDPAFAVKIEYLQRDLVQSAGRRAEYRYPRTFVPAAARTSRANRRALPIPFPLASLF